MLIVSTVLVFCQGDDGKALHWGQHEPSKLFDPDTGWCEAATPFTRYTSLYIS